MADYSGGSIFTGDWSDIPMSDLRPRDNPLVGPFLGAVTDNDLICKIGGDLRPRDNPLPGWLGLELPVQNTVTYYHAMRGKDNSGYKTWVATGAPDTTASQYTGPADGTMTDIVVLQTWSS